MPGEREPPDWLGVHTTSTYYYDLPALCTIHLIIYNMPMKNENLLLRVPHSTEANRKNKMYQVITFV